MNGPRDVLHRPLGEVVRRWREHRGQTLTEFARLAGLSKGYVSEVEHNRIGRPRDKQLERLAEALGISAWDLISRRYPSETSAKSTTSGRASRSSRRGEVTPEVAAALTELRQILQRAAELIAQIERGVE